MNQHFKIRSIQVNAIFNITYTLLNTLFPIITYPYVTRMLKSSRMGLVNFFISVSNYSIMLASLGVGIYGIREVAKRRNNYLEMSKVVQELFAINVICTILVMSVYAILCLISKQFYQNLPLAIANGVWIVTAPLSVDWLFQGLEQYGYITKRNLAFKFISLILIFTCVKSPNDYIKYAIILVFSNVGVYIINFIYAHNFVAFSHYKIQHLNLKRHIKPILILFGSTLAVNVYTNLDVIMLGFIRSNREVGLYTIAVKIETVLLAVVNAISSTLLPRLSHYISENNLHKFRVVLKKSISVIFMITISLTLFFIITARQCIYILGGNDFLKATMSMQILMPILLISGFSNILGNQILIPRGKDKAFLKAVSAGACFDFLLNLVIMKPFGSNGASWATLVAESVQTIIQYVYARKLIKNNIEFKSIEKSLISAFVASSFLILLELSINFGALINMVIFAGSYYIIFVISLLLLKEKNVLYLVDQIKERF